MRCLPLRAFSQLLRDLVYTTDSHRALKGRAAKQAHELESWRDKARAGAMQRSDSERLRESPSGLSARAMPAARRTAGAEPPARAQADALRAENAALVKAHNGVHQQARCRVRRTPLFRVFKLANQRYGLLTHRPFPAGAARRGGGGGPRARAGGVAGGGAGGAPPRAHQQRQQRQCLSVSVGRHRRARGGRGGALRRQRRACARAGRCARGGAPRGR
jgi:hypothetical protein